MTSFVDITYVKSYNGEYPVRGLCGRIDFQKSKFWKNMKASVLKQQWRTLPVSSWY